MFNFIKKLIASDRLLFLIMTVIGLVGIAIALYMQHIVGLHPCPLCIFQRLGLIAFTIVSMLGAIANYPPRVYRIFALIDLVILFISAGIAARHIWLQNLPPDQVPSCGPGLDYWLKTFPLQDVIQKVLYGSGECAVVDWTLFGFSMPYWTLLLFCALILICLYILLRPVIKPKTN